ncbi:MAG: F-box protein [Burkholderiales bacterium]
MMHSPNETTQKSAHQKELSDNFTSASNNDEQVSDVIPLSLLSLPIEILFYITCFLSITDRLALSQVNTFLYTRLSDKEILVKFFLGKLNTKDYLETIAKINEQERQEIVPTYYSEDQQLQASGQEKSVSQAWNVSYILTTLATYSIKIPIVLDEQGLKVFMYLYLVDYYKNNQEHFAQEHLTTGAKTPYLSLKIEKFSRWLESTQIRHEFSQRVAKDFKRNAQNELYFELYVEKEIFPQVKRWVYSRRAGSSSQTLLIPHRTVRQSDTLQRIPSAPQITADRLEDDEIPPAQTLRRNSLPELQINNCGFCSMS